MAVIHGGMKRRAEMHVVTATAKGVSCSCGYFATASTTGGVYTPVRKLAEKHASENRPSMIKPFANN